MFSCLKSFSTHPMAGLCSKLSHTTLFFHLLHPITSIVWVLLSTHKSILNIPFMVLKCLIPFLMVVENTSPLTLNSEWYYRCMLYTYVWHKDNICNCQVWKRESLLLWLLFTQELLLRLFILHATVITPCLEVSTTATFMILSICNLILLFFFSYKTLFQSNIKKVDICSWNSLLFWCSFVANPGKDIGECDALYHCIYP